MKRLYICGHSHGKKIAKELFKGRDVLNAYWVLDLTIPSGKFEDLELPNLPELRHGDVVILFPFSNDLFKSGVSLKTDKRKNRIFHLTHFNPSSEEELLNKYKSLERRFEGTRARVYLFDTFYRHIRCCQKHYDRRILDFQVEQNYRLKAFFETSRYIEYVDHLEFLGPIPPRFQDFEAYNKITPDCVHFRPKIYQSIVKKLINEYL